MKYFFSRIFSSFLILILFSSWKSNLGKETTIQGIVLTERNESNWSLKDNNIVIIIKHDTYHNEIHQLRLQVNQSSFPFKFNLTNIKEIKTSDIYLLTLLIFGYTHRLLWEGSLFRQRLIVNHINSVTFIVKDVCKLDFNNNLCF
jgi:hypothetical protein